MVILVNMDSVFDALQARATLPGLDLWVLDKDGSLLVDPESRREEEALEILDDCLAEWHGGSADEEAGPAGEAAAADAAAGAPEAPAAE